jgi:hypothetical protein
MNNLYSNNPRIREMTSQINKIISGMTAYGRNKWSITKKTGCIITWSNSAASWYAIPISRYLGKPAKDIILDANRAYIPFAAKHVNNLIEAGLLHNLPLYGGSFEVKVRHNYDPIKGITK